MYRNCKYAEKGKYKKNRKGRLGKLNGELLTKEDILELLEELGEET